MVLLTDELRRRQAKEQRGLCFYCFLPLRDDMTWEHLVPKSHKGDNRISNLRVAHERCNSRCVGNLPVTAKYLLHDIGRLYGSDAFFLLADKVRKMVDAGLLPVMSARRPKRMPPRIHRSNVELLVSFLPAELAELPLAA